MVKGHRYYILHSFSDLGDDTTSRAFLKCIFACVFMLVLGNVRLSKVKECSVDLEPSAKEKTNVKIR